MKIITKVCNLCRTKFKDEVNNQQVCANCSTISNRSELEDRLFNIVKIIRPTALNNVKLPALNGKELDMYIPELNLAIEFNGLIWHSEINSLLTGRDKKRDYHKYKLCYKNNISHLLIYEDEFLYKKEQILNILEYQLAMHIPLSGADTYVKRIKHGVTGRDFYNQHALNTVVPDKNTEYVGIYLRVYSTLLGVVCLQKHTDKIEIVGYAWRPETNIKHSWAKCRDVIDQEFKPKKIVFVADHRLNHSHFALALRLRPVGELEPEFKYFKYPEGIRQNASEIQLDIKDTSLTEWERMLISGYNRIWDCGSTIWIGR